MFFHNGITFYLAYRRLFSAELGFRPLSPPVKANLSYILNDASGLLAKDPLSTKGPDDSSSQLAPPHLISILQ